MGTSCERFNKRNGSRQEKFSFGYCRPHHLPFPYNTTQKIFLIFLPLLLGCTYHLFFSLVSQERICPKKDISTRKRTLQTLTWHCISFSLLLTSQTVGEADILKNLPDSSLATPSVGYVYLLRFLTTAIVVTVVTHLLAMFEIFAIQHCFLSRLPVTTNLCKADRYSLPGEIIRWASFFCPFFLMAIFRMVDHWIAYRFLLFYLCVSCFSYKCISNPSTSTPLSKAICWVHLRKQRLEFLILF